MKPETFKIFKQLMKINLHLVLPRIGALSSRIVSHLKLHRQVVFSVIAFIVGLIGVEGYFMLKDRYESLQLKMDWSNENIMILPFYEADNPSDLNTLCFGIYGFDIINNGNSNFTMKSVKLHFTYNGLNHELESTVFPRVEIGGEKYLYVYSIQGQDPIALANWVDIRIVLSKNQSVEPGQPISASASFILPDGLIDLNSIKKTYFEFTDL